MNRYFNLCADISRSRPNRQAQNDVHSCFIVVGPVFLGKVYWRYITSTSHSRNTLLVYNPINPQGYNVLRTRTNPLLVRRTTFRVTSVDSLHITGRFPQTLSNATSVYRVIYEFTRNLTCKSKLDSSRVIETLACVTVNCACVVTSLVERRKHPRLFR